MVGPGEMLGQIIPIIPLSWSPVKSKLTLPAAVAEPVELHVDRFGGLGNYLVVYESLGRLVVRLDRRPWLQVAQFFKGFPCGDGCFGIEK